MTGSHAYNSAMREGRSFFIYPSVLELWNTRKRVSSTALALNCPLNIDSDFLRNVKNMVEGRIKEFEILGHDLLNNMLVKSEVA